MPDVATAPSFSYMLQCCVLGLFLGVVDDGLFCCCFKFRARAHGHDSSAIGYPTNFTVSCSIHLEYAEKQRCWHIQGYCSRSIPVTKTKEPYSIPAHHPDSFRGGLVAHITRRNGLHELVWSVEKHEQ